MTAPDAPETLFRLLEQQVSRDPEAVALLAPDRGILTYGRLLAQVEEVACALISMGIAPSDRVAVVLPNGPEMSVGFLGVAACAVCAPLNPAYRPNEFEFYFSDLKPKALITQAGMDSAAAGVARSAGIAVLEISSRLEDPAGVFSMGNGRAGSASAVFAQPGDVALVLHTSGTTSRPKIVPLTHSNLCCSSRNICAALKLSTSDRCLNVMPLFHIHGLIGAVLSSLTAGASVVCTPGFYATQFFEWLEEFSPTWYTAVPAMHQAILARARPDDGVITRRPLRLIRSSSSALPPKVMTGLEQAFGAPVIESYGMTEASHQMASNPLPPGARKPGSVGLSAGPEIAVMNEAGALLNRGQSGEIVIRGRNVMYGYENNPTANEGSFTDGWFRTGDLGWIDSEGYLFITGRIKEIINRGGEKIAPREIDEVLLDHPAVAQAVAFALPDSGLGEDVGAAVVLREGASATETELRQFASHRLADFKVPARVLLMPQIPRGPTGKIQRIGLAARLGVSSTEPAEERQAAPYIAPGTPEETRLCEIWTDVLRVTRVGIRDNFFDLGGDSVLAASMFAQVRAKLRTNLPLSLLTQAPTIEKLASFFGAEQEKALWASLVPMQPTGARPPLYVVHAHSGQILLYHALAHHLGPDQPVYGLQSVGLDGSQPPLKRVEDMARRYLREIRSVQPRGPYHLAGFCLGAYLALEMACQLQDEGEEVGLLAIFSTDGLWRTASSPLSDVAYHLLNLAAVGTGGKLVYLAGRIRERLVRLRGAAAGTIGKVYASLGKPLPARLHVYHFAHLNLLANRGYAPRIYGGNIVYFEGEQDIPRNPKIFWASVVTGGVEVIKVPGSYAHVLVEPNVRTLAERLKACLNTAQSRGDWSREER